MDCIDHPAFIARTKTAHPEQCPAGLTRDPIYLDVMWVGFHCAVGTTYESWSGKRKTGIDTPFNPWIAYSVHNSAGNPDVTPASQDVPVLACNVASHMGLLAELPDIWLNTIDPEPASGTQKSH